MATTTGKNHLHLVGGEELLKLPLGSRIREVSNIQPTTFIRTGGGGVRGLGGRRSGSPVGGLGGGGGSRGGGLVVGGFLDGRRHLEG